MTNYIEFSAKIKEKYPQYKDIDDRVLAEKMIEKYPEYKEKVTFEEETTKETPKKEKGVDLTPSGLLKKYMAGLNAPSKQLYEKAKGNDISLVDAYKMNREQQEQDKQKHPVLSGLGDFATDIAGYSMLPVVGGSGAVPFVSNAAIQGGVPGVIESLKRGGNIAGGAGAGTGIAAALQGIPYAGKFLSKPVNYIGKKAVEGLTDLKPETLKQVIKPNSQALDLTEDTAQNLLMNTTESVRNAYNNLTNQRVNEVEQAVGKLRGLESRANINELLNDITSTFDKYGGELVNPARNMTGRLEGDLKSLVESARDPLEEVYTYISSSEKPNIYSTEKENEAFDILSKATGKSKQWLKSQLNNNSFKSGNGKRKDFIQDLMENTGDNLDLSKMGNTNDYKYYYNANLGYNNDDINAGYDLANQAYNDIINKNFYNDVRDPLSRAVSDAEQNYKFSLRKVLENSDNPNIMNDAFNFLEKNIKGLPEDIQLEYINKFTDDAEKILQSRSTIAPIDFEKIKQQIGHMVNWSDETARNYKNPILEQIYGKFNNRLSELSPELAQANKAYSDLMKFQKNEGIRKIINKSNSIDNASTALRNYNSTVTKGNTNRNVQDLEKILTDNGYEPFLNNIDDVNAAMDLLTQPKTGRNFLGAQTLAKGLVIPALKGVRQANRNGLSQKIQNIKDLLSPIGKMLPGLGAKGAANVLYGGVEYNDYGE